MIKKNTVLDYGVGPMTSGAGGGVVCSKDDGFLGESDERHETGTE
jgi:hypothetical protein